MKCFIWLFCTLTIGCATHQKSVSEKDTVKLLHFKGPIYISEDYFYDRENSIVYVGDKYVTVIGATWTPETAKLLVDEIKKVTDKPIKEVVNTNWHHDRSGGNSYFKSIGSKIYATKLTAKLMASNWDKMTSEIRKDRPTFPQLPLTLPDSVQNENFELQGGNIKTFYLGQSHTEDGIFVYFPDEKTLYGGCILKGKLGYLGSSNIVEYPKTLQKLKDLHLDFDTVVSGHWSPIHGPELIDQYLDLLSKYKGKKITLPFELVDNRIFVDIFINNDGPFKFLFDTGSSNVMTPEVAKKLKLQTQAAEDGTGAGEKTFHVENTFVKNFQLGDINFSNQEFSIIDFSQIKKAFKMKALDGTIGYEVLQQYLAHLDFEKNEITFSENLDLFAPDKYVRIPFKLVADKPVIESKINGLRADVLIDTGDRSALTVFKNFHVHKQIADIFESKPVQTTGYGGGGRIPAKLGYIDNLTLNDKITLKHVISRAPTTKGGFNALKDMNASIGNEVLRQFNAIFDYKNKIIYLEKNKNFGAQTRFTEVPNPNLN